MIVWISLTMFIFLQTLPKSSPFMLGFRSEASFGEWCTSSGTACWWFVRKGGITQLEGSVRMSWNRRRGKQSRWVMTKPNFPRFNIFHSIVTKPQDVVIGVEACLQYFLSFRKYQGGFSCSLWEQDYSLPALWDSYNMHECTHPNPVGLFIKQVRTYCG